MDCWISDRNLSTVSMSTERLTHSSATALRLSLHSWSIFCRAGVKACNSVVNVYRKYLFTIDINLFNHTFSVHSDDGCTAQQCMSFLVHIESCKIATMYKSRQWAYLKQECLWLMADIALTIRKIVAVDKLFKESFTFTCKWMLIKVSIKERRHERACGWLHRSKNNTKSGRWLTCFRWELRQIRGKLNSIAFWCCIVNLHMTTFFYVKLTMQFMSSYPKGNLPDPVWHLHISRLRTAWPVQEDCHSRPEYEYSLPRGMTSCDYLPGQRKKENQLPLTIITWRLDLFQRAKVTHKEKWHKAWQEKEQNVDVILMADRFISPSVWSVEQDSFRQNSLTKPYPVRGRRDSDGYNFSTMTPAVGLALWLSVAGF